MTVPMLDLYKEYLSIKQEVDSAVQAVIKSESFIGGGFVTKFEKEVANYCGTKYAVGLNSGTDALYLSLWSLGIGKGDEVITTPFTFFATAEVIANLGAKPVFVDIDSETFNIDPEKIEVEITKKTRAIIPVHLFGQAAEMDSIAKIAKRYNLWVIEDAAQAMGARYKNRKVGSMGTLGCLSFYPTKNLGGYGDGGMIVTNDKLLASKINMLRNHGSKTKYQNEVIGINSRLDALQASILSVKLQHLDEWNKKRREIAILYSEKLKKIDFIETPNEDPDSYHVYHQYTILVKNNKRDILKKYLAKHAIESIIYYPLSLHLQKAFGYLGYKRGDFPKSEHASEEVLSLPVYPQLTTEQVDYVVGIIEDF